MRILSTVRIFTVSFCDKLTTFPPEKTFCTPFLQSEICCLRKQYWQSFSWMNVKALTRLKKKRIVVCNRKEINKGRRKIAHRACLNPFLSGFLSFSRTNRLSRVCIDHLFSQNKRFPVPFRVRCVSCKKIVSFCPKANERKRQEKLFR